MRRPTSGEAAALAAAAASLAFQLFVPPRVGLADNGDFNRVMGAFGLSAPPGPDRYFTYFIPRYAFDLKDVVSVPFVSSQKLLVAVAVGLHRLFRGRGAEFDIAFLAAVNALALLAALWVLMVAARGGPASRRWTTLVLLVVVFTDVGYAAYLNSFYSEPASLVFLLAATGFLLLALGQPRLRVLAAAALCMVLLVAAKPQNFAAAPPLAALALRLLVLRKDARWRAACAATGAATLATALLVFARGNPVGVRENAMQVSVFYALLGDSPDPRADLAELGLPPKLAGLAGLHPWSVEMPPREDPRFRRQFFGRMTTGRLLGFYARHPRRLWGVVDRVVARGAFHSRPPLGNYEQATGRPPLAQSPAFAWWGRLRGRLAPRSLAGALSVFGLLLAGSGVLYARQGREGRLRIELLWAIAAVGLGQLLVVALAAGAIDAVKHMFLFKATVDLSLVATLGWLAGAVSAAAARRRPASAA